MLIASRVSVCVCENRASVRVPPAPAPPSRGGRATLRPQPPSAIRTQLRGVLAWVGPPGPQGSLVLLPSAW